MGEDNIKYVIPEDGLYECYANNFLFTWTIFDLRMRFGRLVNVEENGTFVVEQDVSVHMSWTEAKQFADVLQNLLQAFEKANGPIKPPQLPVIPES